MKDDQQESSITVRDARHHRGIVAAFKGGSGVPDTGSPSIRVTSHTSFRPINSLAWKKEGGAGRDRKVKSGHKDEGQKALWMSKEKDYRGREGGGAEARRR